MHPVSLIRSLIICALLYFVSAAPSTRMTSTFPPTSPTTANPLKQVTPKNYTETNNTALEAVAKFTEYGGSPRFFSDDRTDLSDDEAYYVGAILLVNAIVFFGVIFYLLIPSMRICSWFGNCRRGYGYYPAGVANALEDARTLNSFNMLPLYDQTFQKRSLEYVLPILKTLAQAYDQYEILSGKSVPTKQE